jgi:hypothetical protein
LNTTYFDKNYSPLTKASSILLTEKRSGLPSAVAKFSHPAKFVKTQMLDVHKDGFLLVL